MQSKTQNAYYKKNFPVFLDQLKNLVAIPSISTENTTDLQAMKKCAAFCQTLLLKAGMENTRLIYHDKKTAPYVYSEHIVSKTKPTILLYAHYDIQPPLFNDKWITHPFEAKIHQGRIYGRGTADDKGAVIIHCATIASFLKNNLELPVNIKVLFEGEEEAGSPNMSDFIKANRTLLFSDCVIIPDMCNLNFKNPSLTTSLRGIAQLDLTYKTALSPLHSGLYGGIAHDPVIKISELIALLHKKSAGIEKIINLHASPVSSEQKNTLKKLKLSVEKLKAESTILPFVPIKKTAAQLFKKNWRQASINIPAFLAGSPSSPSNSIPSEASARISLRVPPGIGGEKALNLLTKEIKKLVKNKQLITIKKLPYADPWEGLADNIFFKQAKKSLKKAFGENVHVIGSGASIPLADIIQKNYPAAAILLTGIEDPSSKAHAENESLDLALMEKLITAQVAFLEKLRNS